MCLPGQPPERPAVPVPVTAADAVAMAQAGLAFLANTNMASAPAAAQADCLRGLERIESLHTAARAGALAAFMAGGGCQDDGQGSARAWLRWQTRITRGAAAGAVAWARRLAAHPAVGDALADGQISASWARDICAWTGQLPRDRQADADAILLAAAAGGADLADLAGLAEEMRRRCAGPDADDDGGFGDRWLRLDLTLHGAGRVQGDLTPQCAAALQAVLEALGKKAGPEDARTKGQRDHDAVEEACRRLAGAGCLPDRAGQSTQIQLHMTLDQLRGLDGAGDAEAAWAARGPAAAPGSDCDALIVPVVSGHVDPAALDKLAAALRGEPGSGRSPSGRSPSGESPFGPGSPMGARVRRLILRHAADVLSGPAGLAAFLRTGLRHGRAQPASHRPARLITEDPARWNVRILRVLGETRVPRMPTLGACIRGDASQRRSGPVVAAAYDEIADWYAEKFPGDRRAVAGTADGDSPGVSRRLRDLLGEGSGACLEIGCGTGNHAASVRALGWTPIGIDLSGGMLRHAQGRLPAARADAARLPVRHACVPAVIAVMVHTDMPAYPAVLREADRVLRPGGLFVHVGVHPCFCGGFADRADPGAVVIRPGYLDGHWTKASWTDQGVRDKVGATHWPLPDLLHAFIDAGLTPERLAEGGEPTPVVLALRARKHQ